MRANHDGANCLPRRAVTCHRRASRCGRPRSAVPVRSAVVASVAVPVVVGGRTTDALGGQRLAKPRGLPGEGTGVGIAAIVDRLGQLEPASGAARRPWRRIVAAAPDGVWIGLSEAVPIAVREPGVARSAGARHASRRAGRAVGQPAPHTVDKRLTRWAIAAPRSAAESATRGATRAAVGRVRLEVDAAVAVAGVGIGTGAGAGPLHAATNGAIVGLLVATLAEAHRGRRRALPVRTNQA